MAIRLFDAASLLERVRTVNLGRVVLICNLALVIWVAYGAATMTWRFMAKEPVRQSQSGPAPAPDSAEQAQGEAAHQSVAKLHLFGNAKVRAPAPRKAPQKVIETKLKLGLRGVISSDEPDGAFAIIAGPKGDEQGYGIGDILPGNAKLSEIHPEHIVLIHQGREEILSLESGPAQSRKAGRRVRQPKRPGNKRVKPQRPPDANVSELLKQYQTDLQKNPSDLLKVVRPIPVRKAGKFVGFRLGLGRDRDALQRFELEPGDIVTAINGVSMSDPTKGINALRDLKSADMLDLEVERRGVKFTRSFQLP